MSVASGSNELETATMQAEVATSVEDENIVTIEASEDRLVHRVLLMVDNAACLAEVSFSSSFEFNSAANNEGDPIASGVLAVFQGGTDGTSTTGMRSMPSIDYSTAPPRWDAGEEISLHTNNKQGTDPVQVRVLILYEPVGEFSRERLRNR